MKYSSRRIRSRNPSRRQLLPLGWVEADWRRLVQSWAKEVEVEIYQDGVAGFYCEWVWVLLGILWIGLAGQAGRPARRWWC
jgi:hypothetical protein